MRIQSNHGSAADNRRKGSRCTEGECTVVGDPLAGPSGDDTNVMPCSCWVDSLDHPSGYDTNDALCSLGLSGWRALGPVLRCCEELQGITHA